MPDTRDTRPLYTPPSTTPAMPDTPGYAPRPHDRIEKGHAADFDAGKEKGRRATPIGFLAEQVEAQEDKTEQVEDRQKWLASADALTLAAAVREALDTHEGGGDQIAIMRAFTASEIQSIFQLGLEQWQKIIKSIVKTNQETEK